MLDKKPSMIGKMFDTIAPTYDNLNSILSLSIDKSWRRKTIRSLDIHDGHIILDVATGTGDLALLALSRTRINVVGIDLSPEMLKRAKEKIRKAEAWEYYLPLHGDALQLPFCNTAFDRAMVAFGIRNMLSPDMFLKEIYRVLQAGGKLAVLEFSLPQNPVIRRLYFFYFKVFLPVIGGIVSKNFSAYRYLRDSVLHFTPPEELETLMNKKGFSIIHSQNLFFGIAHLYVLRKD